MLLHVITSPQALQPREDVSLQRDRDVVLKLYPSDSSLGFRILVVMVCFWLGICDIG